MRLWSLHPRHLDRAGLVACWREALLAQAVLAGETTGYRNHPQLARFRDTTDPLATVGGYLAGLIDEADLRGYQFTREKIRAPGTLIALIPVTQGQLEFEWQHLGAKLRARNPEEAIRWEADRLRPHDIFVTIPGEIESWERP